MANANYLQDTYTAFPYVIDGEIFMTLEGEDIHRMGILRSSHELGLCLKVKDNKLLFNSAWEMNCGGDWNYKKSEEKLFRDDHPNLLEDLEKHFYNKTLVYQYTYHNEKTNTYEQHQTTDLMLALKERGELEGKK